MAAPLPLEGDGLVENLFHYLWTTDDLGNGPRVSVPPTVVYRGSQPVAWYFTSRKSGRIKRKHRSNLTAAHIEHSFTKQKAPTDIVAYYLYLPNNDSVIPAIEYLDAEALREFLFKRPEIPHSSPGSMQTAGILQQFALPKGAKNSTLRAIWSPKLCLLERRINIHAVHDARFSVYERGVTFEEGGGAEALSRAEPVRGSMLPGMVHQVCERVVDHVTRVSYHKFRIARMVLRLQVDADDHLWLLWSSSLRLQPPLATAIIGPDTGLPDAGIRPLNIETDAKLPNFAFAQGSGGGPVSLSLTTDPIQEVDEEPRSGQARCASCARVVAHRALVPTTYKAILAHFQHVLRYLRGNQVTFEWPPDERIVQQAGGVGFGILRHLKSADLNFGDSGGPKFGMKSWESLVPPVIMYLHPTLRGEDFARHRQDPIFQHKTVGVCERCCLVYADYATASLEANGLGVRSSASAPALLRPTREPPKHASRIDGAPSDALLFTPTNLRSPLSSEIHSTITTKPPASAWQPVPAEERKRKRLGKYKLGPRSTLDSLPIAPILPPRIESFDSDDSNALRIPDELNRDRSPQHQQQDREEAFFRDLYHQKDTTKREGHALKHILDAADRLSKAKPQHRLAALGDSTQIGQSQSTGALVNAIAELKLNRRPDKSPYSIVQRLCADENGKRSPTKNQESSSTSPTKISVKRVLRRSKQQKVAKMKTQGANDADKLQFMSSREQQAAAAHRDFLIAALSDAQVQLEHIESLATLVPSGHGLDVDGIEDDENSDGSEQKETINCDQSPPEEEQQGDDLQLKHGGDDEEREHRIEMEEMETEGRPRQDSDSGSQNQHKQQEREKIDAQELEHEIDTGLRRNPSLVDDQDDQEKTKQNDPELTLGDDHIDKDENTDEQHQDEQLGQEEEPRPADDKDNELNPTGDQETNEEIEQGQEQHTGQQDGDQGSIDHEEYEEEYEQDQNQEQQHEEEHGQEQEEQEQAHDQNHENQRNEEQELEHEIDGLQNPDDTEERPVHALLDQAHELLASAISSDSVDADETSEGVQEHSASENTSDDTSPIFL